MEKSESNNTPRFLNDSTRKRKIPKMSIWKCNLSLCIFEPKIVNAVLSEVNLGLLCDIYNLHPEGSYSTIQRQKRHCYETNAHKVGCHQYGYET